MFIGGLFLDLVDRFLQADVHGMRRDDVVGVLEGELGGVARTGENAVGRNAARGRDGGMHEFAA